MAAHLLQRAQNKEKRKQGVSMFMLLGSLSMIQEDTGAKKTQQSFLTELVGVRMPSKLKSMEMIRPWFQTGHKHSWCHENAAFYLFDQELP